jgi:hypothetical protein
MNKTKLISVVLLVISLSLGGYLIFSIKSSIDEKVRISRVEKKVQDKLMLIRKAEIGYQAVKGDYTDSWDSLASFINDGLFYITERTEIIHQLSYGADSVQVEIDTLGTIAVLDSLFSEPMFSNYDFSQLKFIPETENAQFEIFVAEIEKSGVTVDVIEVRDTQPADPKRSEDNDGRNRKPLRFGSRTEVTTNGNWE